MNLNRNAYEICQELIGNKDELKVSHIVMENGAHVIDCGVKSPGSLESGRLFALACMGGLGDIVFGQKKYGEITLPVLQVTTDHPAVAGLSSQKAGWSIKGEKFFALGSGPARILSRKPKDTYEKVGYSEESDVAVIALEASKYPPVEVADKIAKDCGIDPKGLYILVAKTASVTGAVQISARVVETAIFKIDHMGVDTRKILFALGQAPIAPIVGDDTRMMGVTNDMVIYGGDVYLAASVGIDVNEIPSNTSDAYGKPFLDIFKAVNYDFYQINPAIFAPAAVTLNNLSKGKIEIAGEVNPGVIRKSIGF